MYARANQGLPPSPEGHEVNRRQSRLRSGRRIAMIGGGFIGAEIVDGKAWRLHESVLTSPCLAVIEILDTNTDLVAGSTWLVD